MRTRFFAGLFLAATSLVGAAAHAQDAGTYPDKAIQLTIPFPPGGGTDILARLVSAKLSEHSGWNVVAENRAGAGGTIGIAAATRAKPDGYHLVMGQKDNLVVAPWLYRTVPYQPVTDLVAAAHVGFTPIVIVARQDSPFKTLDDVVQAARAKPDTVTYGSPGSGTTIHLAGEIFKTAAKIDIRHIPYKGSNAAMMDVLAGNVDLMVSSVPSALAQVKAGALRPLAVTSATRSSSLPDVPTVAELGYPDFDVSTWYGVFAPAGTPPAIVERINTEVNRVLALPDTKAAIVAQGVEVQPMTSAAFGEQLATEYPAWKGIVEAAGLKVE